MGVVWHAALLCSRQCSTLTRLCGAAAADTVMQDVTMAQANVANLAAQLAPQKTSGEPDQHSFQTVRAPRTCPGLHNVPSLLTALATLQSSKACQANIGHVLTAPDYVMCRGNVPGICSNSHALQGDQHPAGSRR